ncbi:helicase, partial [Methanosarcinales archaeon]
SEQYKELMKIPQEERELFKKNGVSVKGQKGIVDSLLKKLDEQIKLNGTTYSCHDLIKWQYPNGPNYNQLSFIFDLCWKYLGKNKSSAPIYSSKQLTQRVMAYTKCKSIKELVVDTEKSYRKARDQQSENWHEKYKDMDDKEVFDEAVRDAFQILKHWFHYKVPKWLNVMNELQKYVCGKNNLEPGNYTYYANQIENDFVRENLSILVEYGIPKSAINKLENKISRDLSEDRVLDEIKNKKLMETHGLINYEKEKMVENL